MAELRPQSHSLWCILRHGEAVALFVTLAGHREDALIDRQASLHTSALDAVLQCYRQAAPLGDGTYCTAVEGG